MDAYPVEQPFVERRRWLFGLAYRLLGSATDAEDVLQDAYLRWHVADRAAIAAPGAWLATVVTNLSLNRLASARAHRERYVGPWLPEPVLTADRALGPLDDVEQRESISLGVLILLERLTPAERAVFVLREAFGYRHREIADMLGIDEARSRHLYRSGRRHVGEPRRRFQADRQQQRRIVERLLTATMRGDLRALEELLAEDVVSYADGGGEVTAARQPIVGRSRVLRYLAGLGARPEAARVVAETMEVNGEPAVVLRVEGIPTAVWLAATLDARITHLWLVVHPAKLAFLRSQLVE